MKIADLKKCNVALIGRASIENVQPILIALGIEKITAITEVQSLKSVIYHCAPEIIISTWGDIKPCLLTNSAIHIFPQKKYVSHHVNMLLWGQNKGNLGTFNEAGCRIHDIGTHIDDQKIHDAIVDAVKNYTPIQYF